MFHVRKDLSKQQKSFAVLIRSALWSAQRANVGSQRLHSLQKKRLSTSVSNRLKALTDLIISLRTKTLSNRMVGIHIFPSTVTLLTTQSTLHGGLIRSHPNHKISLDKQKVRALLVHVVKKLGRKMAQGRKEPRRVLGERRVAVGMGFGGNGRGRIRKESEGRGTKGKDQERKAEAQWGARERGRRWEHTDEKEDRGRQGRNTPLSGMLAMFQVSERERLHFLLPFLIPSVSPLLSKAFTSPSTRERLTRVKTRHHCRDSQSLLVHREGCAFHDITISKYKYRRNK